MPSNFAIPERASPLTEAWPVAGGMESHAASREAAHAETGERLELRALFREIWTGCRSRHEWTGPVLFRLFWVFCLCSVCSWTGIVLSSQSAGVATVWISNGVLFGLLITQPPRRWLPYFMAGLAADTLADVVYGDPFLLALGVSCANSLEVVTSAIGMTLLYGTPVDLSQRRPLVGFLGVSVLGATALPSVLGASWTVLFQTAGPWWQLVRSWWLGDMLGMAVLPPLVLVLSRSSSYAMLRPAALRQTLPLLAVPILTTVVVFSHQGDPLLFLLLPALLLVAFRLGFPGTVLSIVLMTLLGIGFTVHGAGPLMLIPGAHMLLHRIVVAQVLAAVSIFTMFPVAALLEEKAALQASLMASEARYKLLAETDALTGLANRRAFNNRLAEEWDRAHQEKVSLGLLLIDADHFKQYNDVFGHLEGDLCLQLLAQVITDVLDGRPAMAARYGGEEFAVLLPGTDAEEAMLVAQQMGAAVERKRLPHPTGPHGVQTVSIGASARRPTRGESAAILVKKADEALYCAKLGGRNRVSIL